MRISQRLLPVLLLSVLLILFSSISLRAVLAQETSTATEEVATEEVVTEEAAAEAGSGGEEEAAGEITADAGGEEEAETADLGLFMLVIGALTVIGTGSLVAIRERRARQDTAA